MENSNEVVPTPQPSQPPQQSKKWYQHRGIITIIILALIGALICWYYYYLNSHAQPCFNKALLMSQIKNFPQADNGKCPAGYTFDSLYCAGAPTWCQPDKASGVTSSSTQENLTNLQTYTSNDLGISIQYPNNWFVSTSTVLEFSNVQNPPPLTDETLKSTAQFTIQIITTTNNLSISDWYQQNQNNFANTPTAETTATVNGYPAVKFQIPETGEWTYYYVAVGSDIYDIGYLDADSQSQPPQFLPIYQTMVSNIKFSSQSTLSDTSDWQSYTNNIYGIQVKYPSYLTLQDGAVDSASLNLNSVATSTYWQGINMQFFNNPDSLSPSDWWSKNQTTQTCYSDPKPGQIAGFNSIETDSDVKCIEFPQDHFPQIRSIFLFFKNRVVEFDVRSVPDADQIIATTEFTNPTDSVVSNGLISYDDNSQLFTVTQKQFKVLDVFTPDYLENYSSGCYGGSHPLSYYQTVLSKFSSSDQGTYYDFNFIGKSQDNGVYEVAIIPNKPGYKTMDQFNADFGSCDAGESLYPSSLSSNNLLFVPACGTGFGDAPEIECGEVQSFVESSIKLNQ
jgi:hypothetical protein